MFHENIDPGAGGRVEEDVSATQQEAQTDARVPEADEYSRWKKDPAKEACPGEKETDGLISWGALPMVPTGRRLETWRPHERLRKEKDFKKVFEAREAYRGRDISLYCCREEGLMRKAAFVAGKKVGGAVARNRARRLMREAFRRLKKSVAPEGAYLVFVAQEGCASRSYGEIHAEMVDLLSRAGLWAGSIEPGRRQ